ncbi:M12 family metallo-peptidase [Pollutibacter soli]|uniref:M12 family metallo-peptidase n=1 Tax=Pollutibacter soli TaxID=3034157 RepID=UPI003013C8C6
MRRILPLILFVSLSIISVYFNSANAQEMLIEADPVSAAGFQVTLSSKFRSWNTYLLKKRFSTPSIQTTRQVRMKLGTDEMVFTGTHHPITDSRSRLVRLEGGVRTEFPFPELLYLNGPNSRLTIGENFILGESSLNGEVYLLENLRNIDPSAPENVLIRYRKSDVIADRNVYCDVLPNKQLTRENKTTPNLKTTGAAGICKTTEIAVLANSTTFSAHNNSLNTTATYIASIYNLSEGDYQDEFTYDLQFHITELVVSVTAHANPWAATDDIYVNLNNFNIIGGDYFKSSNDLSSFWFSTKNFTGGVVGLAYLGFTCTAGGDAAIREYGVSAQSMRCLLSHEHGHNFSMDHDAPGAQFIMAPSVNPSNVDFSQFSKNAFENWFASGQAACITNCDADVCDGSAPELLSIVSNPLTGNIDAKWLNEEGLKGYIVRWKEKSQPVFQADTLGAAAAGHTIIIGCGNARNYRVEVAEICANGNIGEFRGAELINLAIPAIAPNKPTSFCTGGDVTLTSTIAGGNQWYKDNKIIPGATARTYIATASGVYTVKLTIGGCIRTSDPVTVTVSAFPVKPVISVSGGAIVCTGAKVTLTSTAAAGNQWLKSGAPIAGATARTYLPTVTGTYTVKTTNAGGCAAVSDPVTITINPLPPVPLVTASGSLKLCPGTSVILTSNAAAGNQWYKDNVIISGATAKTYKVVGAGTYTVKVTNSSNCVSTSLATRVTYSDNPPVPVITASGPLGICAGSSVTFTSSALSGNQWYFNGVAIAGAIARTYKATSAGRYSVRATNAGGCFANSLVSTVIVYALPAVPAIVPAGPVTICPATEITLTSAAATTYQWYRNSIIIAGATGRTYKANATGRYTVTVGNVYGCKATSLPVTVTVGTNPAKPLVKASGPLSICLGKTVTLTSNTITGNQWYKDGKLLPDSIGKSIVVSTQGKYLLKVSNVTGCATASDTFAVVVNPLPVAPRITSSGALTFCSGKSITLTSGSLTDNQWYKNDVALVGETTNKLVVNNSGNYRVVVTNASGCTNTSITSVVTVNPLPAIPVVTAQGSPAICAGGKVELSSSADEGNQWLKNGVAIAGATAKIYEATTAGQFSVKVTNASNCSIVSTAVTVVVNALPAKPIVTKVGNVLTATAGHAAYAWYKDNTLIPDATSNVYTTTEPGTYQVVVTNVSGCTATSADIVIASPAVNIHGTGILAELRAYPNPARDQVQIRYDPAIGKKCTIRVYDRFGKLMLTTIMKGAIHSLSTSTLPSGVYQVIVSDGTRTVNTKIVIAR